MSLSIHSLYQKTWRRPTAGLSNSNGLRSLDLLKDNNRVDKLRELATSTRGSQDALRRNSTFATILVEIKKLSCWRRRERRTIVVCTAERRRRRRRAVRLHELSSRDIRKNDRINQFTHPPIRETDRLNKKRTDHDWTLDACSMFHQYIIASSHQRCLILLL